MSLQQHYHFVRNDRFHDPSFFTPDLSTLRLSTSLASFGHDDSDHNQNATFPQISKTGRLSVVLSNSDEVLSQRMGSKAEVLERSQEYCNILEHSTFDNGGWLHVLRLF